MAGINNATDLISYKEVVLTIPAGGFVNYQNPYNFLRILSSTGSDTALLFRFGSSSMETYLSVGLGLRFGELLASVTIRNISNADVVLKIAEIAGDVYDDRLTITGDVETKQEPDTVAIVSQMTFPESGELSINSTGYRSVLIQNNSTGASVFCFNDNTMEIMPGGTFEKQFAGEFSIYGTAGENVSVGYFA